MAERVKKTPAKKPAKAAKKPAKGAKKTTAAKKTTQRKSTSPSVRRSRTLQVSPKQEAFLDALRVEPNISVAAEAAGVNRSMHYRWLEEDETYAERFKESWEAGVDEIVHEAHRRAVKGVTKVIVSGGQIVTTERQYSDTLMSRLLSGFRPEVFRESKDVRISGPGGGPVRVATYDQNRAIAQAIMEDPEARELAMKLTEKLYGATVELEEGTR